MENIHIRMGSYMLTINPIFGTTPYNQEEPPTPSYYLRSEEFGSHV